MHSSRPAIASFEQEPKKDAPDLFVGRVGSELGHGKRVGRSCQFVDLIVVGGCNSNFHSMDGNRTGFAQAVLPIPEKALVDRIDVILCGIAEGLAGQVERVVPKSLLCMFIHARSVAGLGGRFHSNFSRWLSMSPSSLFFARGGYANAVASFVVGSRSHRFMSFQFPATAPFSSANRLIY